MTQKQAARKALQVPADVRRYVVDIYWFDKIGSKTGKTEPEFAKVRANAPVPGNYSEPDVARGLQLLGYPPHRAKRRARVPTTRGKL